MIVQLRGVVEEKNSDSVVLLVNGVGYLVYASLTELDMLVVGDDSKLYIYENIREQAHDLFGFLDNSTKSFFEKLVTVNGVGPKMALSIMNIGSAEEIQQAIAQGNAKYLQSATGVGRKVAERIIVDLKDKINLLGVASNTEGLSSSGIYQQDEAFEALVALGYSAHDTTRALSKIDPTLPVEEKIKLVLRSYSK